VNYDYFRLLEECTLCKGASETEQAFMERVLSAVFAENTEDTKDRFNEMLKPRFLGCSAEERSLTVSFTGEDWMRNPNGTLHGGISAAAVDLVMSVLTRFLVKRRTAVTVQLNTNFIKAIPSGETFAVHVTADHAGRRCVMTHAWVTAGVSEKPVITATGVLM